MALGGEGVRERGEEEAEEEHARAGEEVWDDREGDEALEGNGLFVEEEVCAVEGTVSTPSISMSCTSFEESQVACEEGKDAVDEVSEAMS